MRMSDENQIIDRLSEAEDALEADQYQRFRKILPQVFEAYDDARPVERAFTERAKFLTETPAPDTIGNTTDSLDAVATYLVESQRVNANRAGALAGLGVGLPNESADVDLLEFISELKLRERDRVDAREAAASVVSEATIQPLPRVYDVDDPEGPVAVDSPVDLIVRLGNAGDVNISDVTLSISPPDSINVVSGLPDSVDLDAGESKISTLSVTPSSSGEFSIDISIETGDGLFTKRAQLEALDTGGFIDRADSRLIELRGRIIDSDTGSGAKRRLLSSVDAARKSLGRARRALKQGKDEQAEDHLKTATKQLGALLNKLEAADSNDGDQGNGNSSRNSGNKSFTRRKRAEFAAIVEETIDLTMTGTEAS